VRLSEGSGLDSTAGLRSGWLVSRCEALGASLLCAGSGSLLTSAGLSAGAGRETTLSCSGSGLLYSTASLAGSGLEITLSRTGSGCLLNSVSDLAGSVLWTSLSGSVTELLRTGAGSSSTVDLEAGLSFT